ncbi:rab GTPase-binding effector protein 1 [Diorhabda carinulata]|uniref:rab GTPase-binding effector protein 1 n=1 Tax=Diorhabda sublineata TaxID=1163346 RepID=UPI0024E04157|nr:rab GTPase-binding effector protein 1 [Diorhabda sublineata]XP_057661084.1 rab GTPase-binding effector protein 1 [Diorhabda carinulata]
MDQQTQLQNVPDNVKDLKAQIDELISEKKKIQEEFNIQRAKLKDLFLLNEAELVKRTEENVQLNQDLIKLRNELDDCKSQLVVDSMTLESTFEVEKRKAEEEIASLQRLVHETVEESSSTRTLYDMELKKLQNYIQQLQKEVGDLKREKNQSPHHISQEHSLAPSQVFNVLTKGLKKLGADSFSSQESVEDSFKKTEEDAELLKSLVEPLNDQIKALKEKLRATDEQLQRCRECGHQQEEMIYACEDTSPLHTSLNATAATNTSFESHKLSICDMCSNYEAQLVREQKHSKELEAKVVAAEKAAERHKEDLLKEIGFRKDMEEKWNEKKEEHKRQVAELTRMTECTEQDLKELQQFFNQTCSEMKTSLGKLTHEREMVHRELTRLQEENDMLVGKYTAHSQELQSEIINLPDTVQELHEIILKNQQDLIICKIGKEAQETKVNTLQSEIMLLKDRITNDQHERKGIEDSLEHEIKTLRKLVDVMHKEKKQISSNQEKLISSDNLNREKLQEQNKRIEEMTELNKTLEQQNSELKSRVFQLQQELDNTEAVQQDFVRLSQSLQVQLEKIRESDTAVRWQHEEDVDDCPNCRQVFSSTKRKQHCRHCGQIFCQNCLVRTVLSGPNNRPSKVCDVCHTLLDKSSAPYFSEVPPMT